MPTTTSGAPDEDQQRRDMLAQLLAQNPEAVWQAQFAASLPPPPPTPDNRLMLRTPVPGDPAAHTPMPVVVPDERKMRYAAVPEDQPSPRAPFPGVVEGGGTVETRPYELPKSPPKKPAKGKR